MRFQQIQDFMFCVAKDGLLLALLSYYFDFPLLLFIALVDERYVYGSQISPLKQ